MAEELTFISGSKEEQYLSLLPQVRSLIEGEVDFVRFKVDNPELASL